MVNAPKGQIPGIYHRQVGDMTVSVISDGYLMGALNVLSNIGEDHAQRMIVDAFGPDEGRKTAVNTFLIYSGGRVALVDTGCGTYMADTGGKLLQNLEAAGVKPTDIDTVLLTHMHPDHSAGLSDRNTWTPFFPNAELVFHENELKHWEDDGLMAKGTDREKNLFFQCTREQVAPYKKQMRTFKDGEEVFPGVVAMTAHGHTPGHSMYNVQSSDEQLLIWGDIMHVPDIQGPRPDVSVAMDTDMLQAAVSRQRVCDMASSDRMLVAGMHLHFPSCSHVVREGSGFRVIPETWQQ
jgi:glyoxylase-like metal-dependent hydrolase (beta-lactamase superfamily II)